MGTILTETSTFDPQVVSPNPGEPVRASDVLGTGYLIAGVGPNGGLIYVALSPAARVQHLGGISQTLLVTVLVNDITVQLGTDILGNVTSTANDVVTAFNANAMATALASATAQGTGTGLAGVNTAFVAIGQGAQGSIRPPLQVLTNRARYVYNKVRGILLGTLSVKNIYADGVGDGTNSSSGADIETTAALRAGTQVVAQTNISSVTGFIQTIDPVNGDMNAAHDLNADNDLFVGNDATITNQTESGWFQIDRNRGGTTLPNTAIPLGQVNRGNVLLGMGSFAAANTPTVSLIGSLGINTVTHPGIGQYTITFHATALTYVGINISLSHPTAINPQTRYNITSYSPLTVDVFMLQAGVITDVFGFTITANGE